MDFIVRGRGFPFGLGRFRRTPAIQAGVTDRLWKMEDRYDAVMAS